MIGCLLEFDGKQRGKAKVSFCVNGKDLGSAFEDMPAGKYYPMISLASTFHGGTKNCVMVDPRAKLPDCYKRGAVKEE